MKSIQFAVVILLSGVCMVSAQDSGGAGRDPAPAVIKVEAASDGGSPQSAAVADTSRTAVTNAYVRPDSRTRFRRYVNSMFGPAALGRTVLSAGISTWRNSPEEWGDNWEGFGRRVASGMGRNAIKQTAIYGLDEALKYDSRFYRSEKKSFGPRLGNALISPVTARDKNGKRVLGVPRIAGTYTASIIAAETWYPSRYDYKDGLKNGTISLGINAAFNVFREFVWKK